MTSIQELQLAAASRELTQLYPIAVIHSEDTHGSASGGCQADDMGLRHRKMERPSIAPRMVKDGYIAGLRIDAGEVRALVKVAMLAGVSQIIERGRPAMLDRNNVLDMK